MKSVVTAAILLAIAASALAQTQPPPPAEQHAFVVEHVPEKLPPAEQKVEDRCVRLSGSHASRGREDRQTKGTQGIHGECAGQQFSGTTNDLGSGIQAPVR